jgi:hypothetical protein
LFSFSTSLCIKISYHAYDVKFLAERSSSAAGRAAGRPLEPLAGLGPSIPSALQTKFEEHLRNKTIQSSLHGVYKKWLQYYLDFCRKYHFPPIHKESPPHFILKLQEKKQTKYPFTSFQK